MFSLVSAFYSEKFSWAESSNDLELLRGAGSPATPPHDIPFQPCVIWVLLKEARGSLNVDAILSSTLVFFFLLGTTFSPQRNPVVPYY